ncbi:hypothetical protein GY45DRAFT_536750 [Cubamyces sp. BRFM 1775]|nr:hypothetical protein GY45DRAFT_536750 [Cubamyces sp. BRFM 1775]
MSQPESSSASAQATSTPAGEVPVVPLAQSSAGRVSGKAWKMPKAATVRSHLPDGVKAKSWEDRMEKTKKEQAIKKLQAELKQEKQDEIKRRREITLERKKAAEERQRLEEAKAKVRLSQNSRPRPSRRRRPLPCGSTHAAARFFPSLWEPICRWAHAKPPGYAARWAAPRKSTTDRPWCLSPVPSASFCAHNDIRLGCCGPAHARTSPTD